jgi:hypothetical protein
MRVKNLFSVPQNPARLILCIEQVPYELSNNYQNQTKEKHSAGLHWAIMKGILKSFPIPNL